MRRILVYLMGMMSLLGQASDLPKHPELHAAINAHLLTEKEKYFGAIPFRPITPSEHRGSIYSERFKKAGSVLASSD